MLAKSVEDWQQEVAANRGLILRELQKYIPIENLVIIPGPLWNFLLCGEGTTAKYCIKVLNEESIPVDWTITELDYVGRAMSALKQADFAYVLPPIPLQDGAYAARLAGYVMIVYPWFPAFGAHHLQTSPSSYISAVTPVLHELHCKGRMVAEKIEQFNSPFSRKYTPSQWLNQADSLWTECERIMQQLGAFPEVFSALQAGQKISAEIVSRFPEFFSPTPAEITIVHGDFRPENILIQNDVVQLVYDFDFMRLGRAEEDIAYSALYCSGPAWFSGSRDWKICGDFINSYQASAITKQQDLIDNSMLEAALYWTLLKEISLSFDAEGVIGRYQLLTELTANLNWILP